VYLAGYIFSLNKIEALNESIMNGIFGTVMSPPKKSGWIQHHEATFADYCKMKHGDNMYFFKDRNIYGIGTLLNLGSDCKFNNYPGASSPHNLKYDDIKQNILLDIGEGSENIRWICAFKPAPFFFQ
jgi:hypothetical protein